MFLLGSAFGTAGALVLNWITDSIKNAHLQALLDKQTSVIDLTAQGVIGLEKTLNDTTSQQNEEIWATTWLAEAFDNVLKHQKKIVKMIAHETFEIDGIPINVMMDQAKIITYNSKHNRHLFGENTFEQALNMYKLAWLSNIVLVKNAIITIIKIPMITDRMFVCRKITPIPFARSKKTEIITIQGQYVLFNKNISQYYIKTDFEMKHCMQLNDNTLCEVEKILLKNTTNECELSMVLNSQNNSCKATEYTADVFLQKIRPLTWLYSVNRSTIYIECLNKSYTAEINGSGLLTLNSTRNARINNTIIRILEYEISNVALSTEQWQTISLKAASASHILMENLKIAMQELKKETMIHRFFHIHHTTILYVFIRRILFCFFIIWFRNRQNKNTQPIIINN